jgi:hypothetical protein
MRMYWYSGAIIVPRKQGYDVILTKARRVHRQTERQAKWAATAFKTLHGVTFQETIDAVA